MEPSVAAPVDQPAPRTAGATPAGSPLSRGSEAGSAPGSPPAEAAPAGRWQRWITPPGDAVTAGEVAALVATAVVGVLGLASLVAAHLGVHDLASVFGFTGIGLVLLGIVAFVRAGFPAVSWDPPGLLAAAGSGLLAAFMFLPGFHYVAGDKDPGAYVAHAFEIARNNSVWIQDPLLAAGDLPVQLVGPGARFPAIWIEDAATGEIFPQFYHLWPAFLATSYDVGGYGALVATTPLLGVLCVILTVLIARRIAGTIAALIAGLLISTNMMQVWQAKYPTTEILSQALFLGSLLGVILALRTGWRWAALVAGLLIGVGYLTRPDGLVLVLLCVGALAALWVLRRFDARAGWFAAGLGVLLPYALWQAYGPAGRYTLANDIPGLRAVLALMAVCVVGALVLRPLLTGLTRRVDGWLESDRVQRRVGLAGTAAVVALFGLGVIRPKLGQDMFDYNGRMIRSYDELNLHRLSWFFTWPGLLLIVAGVALVALRRWSAQAWVVAVPTVGLLTLYAWHARNSPYFMWVGRRFVPTVLPGMVLLIALALAVIWAWKWRDRFRVGLPVAAALVAFLAAVQLSQSIPLRSHDEWNGSYGINNSLSALSGDQRGIYLWQPGACCTSPQLLFGSTIWLVEDEDSALLPRPVDKVAPYVREYVETYPDRPVFLLYQAGSLPPPIPGVTTTVAGRFAGTMPHWIESSGSRPAEAQQIPYDFTAYRVQAAD